MPEAGEFERILDQCIDRISGGQSAEKCLADYPEHAARLKPILSAMSLVRATYAFKPSPAAKARARQRLENALLERSASEKKRPSFFVRLLAQPVARAALAAVAVMALVGGYIGLKPGQSPALVVLPDSQGNFAFLISDEVNAINDFSSVMVDIERVELSGGHSIEFTPEVRTVDLTQVPGEATIEIWRGEVPQGDYSRVLIEVARVSGVLKSTGENIAIKLPSQKLHINKSFRVSASEMTRFTYDLTVVAAGNGKGKYLLKPQAGESGAVNEARQTGKETGKKPDNTPGPKNVPGPATAGRKEPDK